MYILRVAVQGGAKSIRAITLVLTLILASVFSLILVPEETSGYTPHSPIAIDGNLEFTGANGVTGGSGTALDPYIIEGWEINASSKTGIEIRNTDSFFVISDVFVHSGLNGSLMTHDGIYLYNVSNGKIENSTLLHNENGIHLFNANLAIVANNHLSANSENGIFSAFSDGVMITKNNATANLQNGILLSGSDDSTVIDNQVSDQEHGIEISVSERVEVSLNEVWNNTDGILLTGSIEPTIDSNDIHNNEDGILLSSTNYATIVDNTISFNNRTGLYFFSSFNPIITGNLVEGNGFFGIYLYSMTDAMLESNDIYSNNFCGVLIKFSRFTTVRTSNVSLNNDYGVCIESCDNTTVASNMVFMNADDGIILTDSFYSSVDMNNVISNGGNGIFINSSHMMRLSLNQISDNGWSGMLSQFSSLADIFENRISGNDYGATLVSSYSNMFHNNDIRLSTYVGISLTSSLSNRLYHNNIIANTQQAYDNTASSKWDDGYPSGGNYWSDYTGPDQMNGPNQDIPGFDFIGDTPYVIDSDSEDRYPFTFPLVGDSIPPIVNITFPLDGQIFNTEPITVTGTAQDSGGSGLETVMVRNPPTILSWTLATGTSTWSAVVNLSPGFNTIEARAWDYDWNPSVIDLVTITYDPPGNDPPEANFTVKPASGGLSVTFTVNASASVDMEDPTSALAVRWDWEDDGIWDTLWSTTKTEQHQYTSPGTYNIRLQVMDTGGLTNETTRQLVVTAPPPPPPPPVNQRPDCDIVAPGHGDALTGTYTIRGTASDSDGSLNKVEIKIDNGDWILANGKTSWSLELDTTTIPNGEHTIHARSFDGEDYSSTDSVTITVDNVEVQEGDLGVFWFSVAIILLILTIVLLILLFLALRKRKDEEEDEPEAPSREEMPESEAKV